MTDAWYSAQPNPAYAGFKRIPTAGGWFEVYEIAPDLFVFHEPRHYEGTIVNLVIGRDKAALIDTGCGIGNLREAVEAVTAKPVVVINTHTHLDHLGSNRQFEDIAMFDHPLAHRAAEQGADHQTLQKEILADGLVAGPWPAGFEPGSFHIPRFKVSHWLADGDSIDLGDRALEVIYTPGEAPDHISLLDRANRNLFCGDILLQGSVWTHLEGGSVTELAASYRRLMGYFDAFDHVMPGHNDPWLGKDLLPDSLAGAEKVIAGQAEFEEITDLWGRRLKKYSFGRFGITTRIEA